MSLIPKTISRYTILRFFWARHRNFEAAIEYFNQALAIDNSVKNKRKACDCVPRPGQIQRCPSTGRFNIKKPAEQCHGPIDACAAFNCG